ncbi:uncharacterized protein TNCV_889741 [Trichonephila clavipes]|nr:uncharacterized protein TNCV_889741 [Trichonephila clavipes]
MIMSDLIEPFETHGLEQMEYPTRIFRPESNIACCNDRSTSCSVAGIADCTQQSKLGIETRSSLSNHVSDNISNVQFCELTSSKSVWRPGSIPLQSSVLVRGTTPNGGGDEWTPNAARDPKCPSARRIRMVREDTGARSEGATCAWMVADEAVGCTRAFLTMWWFTRRLVFRGCPEPGFRVNDISWIQWSQHLLTTQSDG